MELYNLELNDDRHPVLVFEKALTEGALWVNSPDTVAAVAQEYLNLSKKAEEYVYMFALDAKSKVLGVFEVFRGAVNESLANPREIYLRALVCGAVGIIVVHNHPSLDPAPSGADRSLCKRLWEAGELLGVHLLDFVITGKDYYSFREQNEL